jgi:hypothetical protein
MQIDTNRTRLAAIVGIAALLGGITMAAATGAFGDIDEDRFYAASVDWAYDNGITEGTSATTFEPDRALTRGEGVTMLHRFSQGATGGMHFELIREHMQADGLEGYGTAKTLLTVDGVSLKIQCYSGGWLGVPEDSAPAGEATGNASIGMSVWFESIADDWYSAWEDSSEPLESIYAPDDYVYGETEAVYGPANPWEYANYVDMDGQLTEYLSYEIDGISATTPNGGYIAVDGETTQFILNSSVRDNDCEFYGMVQWAEPPGD